MVSKNTLVIVEVSTDGELCGEGCWGINGSFCDVFGISLLETECPTCGGEWNSHFKRCDECHEAECEIVKK